MANKVERLNTLAKRWLQLEIELYEIEKEIVELENSLTDEEFVATSSFYGSFESVEDALIKLSRKES